LAWGVNLPAHLVVIKGTEFFDAKTKRYVDFPITDVLQMMGRAGRPQFDDHVSTVVFSNHVLFISFVYHTFETK
jgi:activating signal cointegrator complex subunit 3